MLIYFIIIDSSYVSDFFLGKCSVHLFLCSGKHSMNEEAFSMMVIGMLLEIRLAGFEVCLHLLVAE